MLDVHPPHESVHTWRDFFIHIATIVIGLLIAIGLEQSVEYAHHRHQLHTAEHNLAVEIAANRKTLAMDESELRTSVQHLHDADQHLEQLRAHQPLGGPLTAEWTWNDLAVGAWDTARAIGTTSLMTYDQAQHYADIYEQQTLVNSQASIYIRGVYRIGAPMELGKSTAQLTPDDIDKMQAAITASVSEVTYLLDLCSGLDLMYAEAAH
jgi:hypothetical protein